MAWKDAYYVKAHGLARDGLNDDQIASAMGVKRGVFKVWLKQKPALREALEAGRKKGGVADFGKWAAGRMPKKAAELWERLEMLEDTKKDDPDAVKKERSRALRLIDMGTVREKQHVFLKALMKGNFMPSIASRITGIDTTEFKTWLETDRGFARVWAGLQEAKKDFYESSLIELVKQGDSAAVIFANKTINRDRGYDTSTKTLNITGMVDHKHSLSPDEIPHEAKLMMLDAIRKKKEAKLLEDRSSPITDAEFTEKR